MTQLYKFLSHKFFIFILLFYTTNSTAQTFDAIINLGGDCQVAYQLQTNGLRQYALPFDALITPYETLQKILEHNCDGFMTQDNFVLADDEKYALDQKYGSRLIHDFKLNKEEFLTDYEEIATKYQRRIERLQYLTMNSEYPLFIRKHITKEQAIKLRDTLSTIRQGKPFLLVALDGTEEMQSDWQLENVRNYYLRQRDPYTWKGDGQVWKEIFQAIGLKTNTATAHEQ